MNVGVFYYSATGNTRLACRYIARNLKNADVKLIDITQGEAPSLYTFDLVGFATFTDFWGPPFLMQKFVEGLPLQRNKPAFIFATHGGQMSNLLKIFARWLREKEFVIVGSHGLRAPESFPPAIARGNTAEDAPNDEEMRRFDEFIRELNDKIDVLAKGGREIPRGKVNISVLANFSPTISRMSAKKNMGGKFVDEQLCNECGICEKACPYIAIMLNPKPVFDESKCYGCWACFNRCPTQAIYTAKLRGKGHYSGPTANLQQKLGAK